MEKCGQPRPLKSNIPRRGDVGCEYGIVRLNFDQKMDELNELARRAHESGKPIKIDFQDSSPYMRILEIEPLKVEIYNEAEGDIPQLSGDHDLIGFLWKAEDELEDGVIVVAGNGDEMYGCRMSDPVSLTYFAVELDSQIRF